MPLRHFQSNMPGSGISSFLVSKVFESPASVLVLLLINNLPDLLKELRACQTASK